MGSAKPDWRGAHQRALSRMVKEAEKRTGHTPTDATQRKIERRLEQIAEKQIRKKEK